MVFNRHIGMYTIDRPPETCIFSSNFCKKTCYNNKLYKGLFGDRMRKRDKYNRLYWDNLNGPKLREILKRKREWRKRIRFCSRGEAINNESDIRKIRGICYQNPNTVFWLPTRSYVDYTLKALIELYLWDLKNIRIQASIDVSTHLGLVEWLISCGWSTIFYGDNKDTENRVLCPKTWLHYKITKGFCRKCNICFGNLDKPIHVHLKQH